MVSPVPPSLFSALPPQLLIERSTKIDFAENQLFLRLIGLSPLRTAHLSLLQQALVRSFKTLSEFFQPGHA